MISTLCKTVQAASGRNSGEGNHSSAQPVSVDRDLTFHEKRERIDEVGDEQSAAAGSKLYPQICEECYRAWQEKRFEDIGRHQIPNTNRLRDKDCLLWKVMSHGSSGDPDQEPKTKSVESFEVVEAGAGKRISQSSRSHPIVLFIQNLTLNIREPKQEHT